MYANLGKIIMHFISKLLDEAINLLEFMHRGTMNSHLVRRGGGTSFLTGLVLTFKRIYSKLRTKIGIDPEIIIQFSKLQMTFDVAKNICYKKFMCFL